MVVSLFGGLAMNNSTRKYIRMYRCIVSWTFSILGILVFLALGAMRLFLQVPGYEKMYKIPVVPFLSIAFLVGVIVGTAGGILSWKWPFVFPSFKKDEAAPD